MNKINVTLEAPATGLVTIKASAYKDGPQLQEIHSDFPANLAAALAVHGENEIFEGWAKTFSIEAQAKLRSSFKAPLAGNRTKRGSVTAQARANAIRAALAASSVEENAE
jgi:phosphoribosylformimino-5-aminoimidazole carboxamide ribonucleotide (ProFAR) isomerase